jgi:protoporphyrinogen oxidase
MSDRYENDFVILGAGLCGLAAASLLGDHAIVLEREDRPGGLVRSECHGGYWFDHVLHLLYFQDQRTEERITALLGDSLPRIQPEAWVETRSGTVRFPFQMHLGGLETDTAIACVLDLVEEAYATGGKPPENFEEMLLRTFGKSMCELFLFPYNRKMWRRPLAGLAPSGFQWNIARPELARVLAGAVSASSRYQAYNARGWYPRPPHGAPLRGMEVLSAALAGEASDIRLAHTVESIDLDARTVVARGPSGTAEFHYRRGCLSTLPLPALVSMCRQSNAADRRRASGLLRNRVITAAFSIEGPRPQGRGNWRYYADESLVFTRLIYLHEFDPGIAPPEGWVLMAEVTERAEDPMQDEAQTMKRIRRDVFAAGAIPSDCRIIDEHMLVVDPAYVVFTPDNAASMESLRAKFAAGDVTPMGRYGRWEYSSMAQVMRDGFAWAEAALGAAGTQLPEETGTDA